MKSGGSSFRPSSSLAEALTGPHAPEVVLEASFFSLELFSSSIVLEMVGDSFFTCYRREDVKRLAGYRYTQMRLY